jgi:hypothetical protein
MPVKASRSSRFYRFLDAAKLGFNGDPNACDRAYECPYTSGELFDDKMLSLFQLVGRELNIEFVDYE